MNKNDEEVLKQLRELRQKAKMDLETKPGYENYEVKNVKYYGKVNLVRRETGTLESFDLHVIEVADKENKTGYVEQVYYLNGQEIDFTELIREYESPEPIKDVVDKAEENKKKPKEQQDEKLEIKDLNELEEKKEKEKETDKDNKEKTENSDDNSQVKIKPTHIIEKIDPDEAKMDYWKTIKQAFGLPPQVETLAFAYPVSSEDKVDYSNITLYMLDNEGNIIQDLDVDDYFEFDSSTGNNPMSDNAIRVEEDENRGQVQIEENRTMIRLKAKKSNDKNSYISLEQKNGLGDYNDVNAGRKIRSGTQNVEKQLENTHVPAVWNAENERFVDSRNGKDALKEKYEEAQIHKEHGDEGYIDKKNADGKKETIEICENPLIPGTDKTWDELSDETGESISKLQERFIRELERNKKPEEIVEEIEADYEMVGHEHEH